MNAKNVLCTVLSVGTAVSMLTAPLPDAAPVFDIMAAAADNEIPDGDDLFSYTFSNGVLTITGFNNLATRFVIPDTVDGQPVKKLQSTTLIFTHCQNLQSIVLPKYLTAIPDGMLQDCPSLTSVNIPEGVTVIGSGAFYGCTGLKEIKLPAGLQKMDGAFYNCTGLTEVSIPDGIRELNYAFMGCTDLTSITLPENLEILFESFYDCTSLTGITIPKTVSQIERSFNHCTSLTEIAIPESVQQLNGSFVDCTSLTSVYIPAAVKDMEYAFSGCSSLEAIHVDADNKIYSSVDGVLFSKGRDTLLLYPQGKSDTEYTVPDEVTRIISFSDAQNLNSITLPPYLTEIVSGAFSNCSSLEQLTIPDGVREIQLYTFYGCSSLKTLTLPKSLIKFGRDAIYCPSLTDMYYEGSVLDWSKIKVEKGNESLYQVHIHFHEEGTDLHQNATLYTAPSVLPVPEKNVSYQIKTTNPDATFSVIAGNAAEVSKTGLVTPTKKYGETIIQITDGDNISFLHVTTEDYAPIYADRIITEFLNENITEDMTDPEKLNIIGKLPASMDYSSYPDSYVDMIAYHTGNCIGSATMLEEMCRRLGIKAWVRNANRDPNAGSAHVNALAEVDGVYYELEAGYSGTAPRAYKVTKRTSLYKYKDTTDGIDVYQYDGIDENDTALQIPDSIDGKSVTCIGDSFLKENPWVISVTVPDTVKEISDSAFSDFQGVLIGKRDSVAAKFAAAHGIAFQAADSLIAGDVNGDQVVNILDVIAVNKYLLGCKKLEEWQEKAADVDGNDFVEANDSLNILKFALDVILSFDKVS